MDSQLKTLGIRLSNIWELCQTEMTEMNGKIKRLGDCLLTSDVIISHLTKTNETLVEIIEKCGLNARNNPEVIALAQKVSKLEEYIDREKDNLMVIKKSLKNSNNGNKVVDLIYNWDKCVKMKDKCIQTTEELFNTNIECNEDIVVKSETIDITSGNMKNSLSIDIDCESDVSFGAQDVAEDDCNDSDFELMSNTNKTSDKKLQQNIRTKKKTEDEMNTLIDPKVKDNKSGYSNRQSLKRSKNKKEFNHKRRQMIDRLVLPMRDQWMTYICNHKDCKFRLKNKWKFYDHVIKHQMNGDIDDQQSVDTNQPENSLANQTTEVIEAKFVDNKSDIDSDVSFDAQDVAADDGNDSDFEIKSKKRKKTRKRLEPKGRDNELNTYPTNGNDIEMDKYILPEHLRDDQYLCTETDCHFRTPIKYRFHCHLRRHRTSIAGTKSYRYQERVDDLVIPLWDPIKKLYVCNWTDCTAEILSKGIFYKHMRQHIPLPKPSLFSKYKNMNQYKVNDKYVCVQVGCDFTATVMAVFYRHWRQHNPIPVNDNKKQYDLSLPKPYVCEWPGCSVAFKTYNYLSKHIKRVHEDNKRLACNWPGCDYRTYSSYTLKQHTKRHTKQKNWLCTWLGCEYRCIDQWSMIAHMRKHTGEKPYSCPYPECGFRCSKVSNMKAHIHIHTGEKPYVCTADGCGKGFSAPSGLYIHRKSHHK